MQAGNSKVLFISVIESKETKLEIKDVESILDAKDIPHLDNTYRKQ